MGDRDRLAIGPQLSFEHYAELSRVQIYSLERYIEPTIISKHTRNNCEEISVRFITRIPVLASVLELVLEDDAGVNIKVAKNLMIHDRVHWNLNTSVPFAVSSFSDTDLLRHAGMLGPIPGLHWPSGKRVLK
jgi:hypothetical protein